MLPGKLRGNQYKSMMSKEELEEEQRILLNTNAKIYLQLANSNPLHQQLHPNQMNNHCSSFHGQESCVAKNALVIWGH
ncbi:hypothetical protein IHE44_0006778 [Lamprotornis superbus]|uniref:Uncharacterized protein n=1 Tax=Lamprotornis superbus TaxID=245042 RepID=A0A835NG94_9PASS|nr:hypothetical protein IHE44_0006778 [Lamprotornis superbus]